MTWLWYGISAVCALVWLVALFRTRKPLRRVLGSTLQGACAVAAVNVSGALTGVSLGLNWLSAVVCATLGVPGVIGLLLLQCLVGM